MSLKQKANLVLAVHDVIKNVKKNKIDFKRFVDYIFDVFENEGFKNIDINFMNDYFNFINFSESFKRTNLISYMMKNTNLLFSKFNSFNF